MKHVAVPETSNHVSIEPILPFSSRTGACTCISYSPATPHSMQLLIYPCFSAPTGRHLARVQSGARVLSTDSIRLQIHVRGSTQTHKKGQNVHREPRLVLGITDIHRSRPLVNEHNQIPGKFPHLQSGDHVQTAPAVLLLAFSCLAK